MKLPLALCLALPAGVSSLSAVAESETRLDEVVVTASRSEEPLSESLAPVTVITRADIERLQTLDVPELLVGLPGVGIASNGGAGKNSALYLRGTESDHVLVLVDGVKMGSATSGSTAFEQMPLDQIERIEIVRGPRSSLYGSEAIGGVVQIFTRRGTRRGAAPSFTAARGTRGDRRLEASVRGSGPSFWYSLGLSGRSTDGINVRPSLNEPDKDGYENRAGSLRTGYHFDNGAELAATYLLAESKNFFDGSSQNQSEAQSQVLGTTLRFNPLEAWQTSLAAGQSRDESDNLLDGRFVGHFDTRRDHYSWLNEIRVTERQTVSLGSDYQDDHVDSDKRYAETSRDNLGVFGLYRAELGAHELQLSARSDDNEQFGQHETGGAAYAYRINERLRAVASYGTAFKAPTFNELYYPGFGSPDIAPEKSRNAELSLTGTHLHWQWALNIFRNQIEDLIGTERIPDPARPGRTISVAANVDEALIRGLEAQLGARWGQLRAQTYFTWIEPENVSGGANDGNTLPRRREQSARLDLDYDWRRLSTGLTVFGASEGYDNADNTVLLPGYATLALRAGLQVMPDWLLQVEGRNLLDKTYETAATYALPGASFMATIRFTPTRF